MKSKIELGLLLLLFLFCNFGAFSQTKGLIIVTTKDSFAIKQASITMNSKRGWLIGKSFQDFEGIYVTDSRIPAKYETTNAQFLRWSSIQSIEFINWGKAPDGMTGKIEAKITKTKGSISKVFLYGPYWWPDITLLQTGHLKIKGKRTIGGVEKDEEIYLGIDWRKIIIIH